MPTAIAIQVLPLGVAGKEEIYTLVNAAIAALRLPDIRVYVGPFETVIEGPDDSLWLAARSAHEAVIRIHPACATYMKVFTAPDLGTTEEKVSRHR